MRWAVVAGCLCVAGPAFADMGLLDPQGRAISRAALSDLVASATLRPDGFDVVAWQEAHAASVEEPENGEVLVADGAPLTTEEVEAFRHSIQVCWAPSAAVRENRVPVAVAFSLTKAGMVDGDIVETSQSSAPASLRRDAFEAARQAILRCQQGGYALPVEKYAQWRDVELIFDPAVLAND